MTPPIVKKILLARSSAAFHFEEEFRDNNGQLRRAAFISDGTKSLSTWASRNEWRYLGRFATLTTMINQAKTVSANVPADSNCSGPSTMVELKISQSRMPAVEQLRILNESALVCESVVRVRLPDIEYGPLTRTTVWRYLHTEEPIEESLFVLSPQPEAKKVRAVQ